MLDTTLATTFTPGTNVKGDVAGANWTFLLPSRALRRIMCIGMPPASTLNTLRNIGQAVLVLCTSAHQSQQIAAMSRRYDLQHVSPLQVGRRQALPLAAGSVDMAVILGRRNVRRMHDDRTWQNEVRRVLGPHGFIYLELTGFEPARTGGALSNGSDRNSEGRSVFWLTPLLGEAHTAVPVQDDDTSDYFLRHRLYSPSINPGTLLRVKRLLKGRGAKGSAKTSSDARPDSSERSASYLRSLMRSASKSALRALERSERSLIKRRFSMRRYGVLSGPAADCALDQPPRYVCSIAREAGIDLTGYGWGLTARGGYSSRKVLFYLFDRNHEHQSSSQCPAYIVKMVRDAAFNMRLENEYRGLLALRDTSMGRRGMLPKAAFFGHHQGLAILGQAAIAGAPFRERTKMTADCAYLHAAIDFLTELGTVQADPAGIEPARAAAGLRVLLARFQDIYHLAPPEYAFMAAQIEAITTRAERFPLVFQHGDPGPWNVMVMPTGQLAFLDWEANEPRGMPLWDFFYFMNSYCVDSARALGIQDRLVGLAGQFLGESALSRLCMERTRRYCDRVGLDPRLIEPLFYTCWMHRALKESTRLAPARLQQGHYVTLLRLCIERRHGRTLARLFGDPQ